MINPQFDAAFSFDEVGLGTIMLNQKWGCIDKTGKIVINPQFDAAFYFGKEGLAVVLLNKKYGYIDKTGNIKINYQFDYARSFSEDGLARVVINNKWGYINKNGNFEINPQFDAAGAFNEGFAAVKVGDKYCYIDKSGKIVIISNFRGNIAPGGNTDSGTGVIILPVLQAGHTESISLVDQFPEKKLQRKGRGILWRLPGSSADSSTHIGPLR